MTLKLAKPTGAKLNLSKIQQYPAVIGEPWGGGYFAGYISHTANGVPTHALIVAPKSSGASGTGYSLTTNYQLKTSRTATNAYSEYDGVANTAAMVSAGIASHPAANFCASLSIGGFTDWYLPAWFEQDIAYFNLKPTTASNFIWSGIGPSSNNGSNIYSIPQRPAWSATHPAQTYLPLFRSGGGEEYVAGAHWSSTHSLNDLEGRFQMFSNGDRNIGVVGWKDSSLAVRAFRRIALP